MMQDVLDGVFVGSIGARVFDETPRVVCRQAAITGLPQDLLEVG